MIMLVGWFCWVGWYVGWLVGWSVEPALSWIVVFVASFELKPCFLVASLSTPYYGFCLIRGNLICNKVLYTIECWAEEEGLH